MATHVQVVNAGVAGIMSGQELAEMIHRVDALRPDVYVVFDGWNDLIDSTFGTMRRPGEFGLGHTFFAVADRLTALHRGIDADDIEPRKDEDVPFRPEPAYLEDITDAFTENLSRMNAFAQGRGARLLVVFQPELGSKHTLTPGEVDALDLAEEVMSYRTLDTSGSYRKMIARAARFCDENDIPYLVMHEVPEFADSPDRLFQDVVHPNAEGNRIIAEQMTAQIAALLPVEEQETDPHPESLDRGLQ